MKRGTRRSRLGAAGLDEFLRGGSDQTAPIPRYHPAPVQPAPAGPRTYHAGGPGWRMIVDQDAPPVSMDDRLKAARDHVILEVAYLEAEDMGYRIDDAEQIRQRGDKLDGRSIIARTARKGAAHLLGPRTDWLTRRSGRPWAPAGGWNEDWLPGGLAWYDPDARQAERWWDGPPPEPWTPPAAAQPPGAWHHPAGPDRVVAAFNGNGRTA